MKRNDSCFVYTSDSDAAVIGFSNVLRHVGHRVSEMVTTGSCLRRSTLLEPPKHLLRREETGAFPQIIHGVVLLDVEPRNCVSKADVELDKRLLAFALMANDRSRKRTTLVKKCECAEEIMVQAIGST